jgi:hypothetical protein
MLLYPVDGFSQLKLYITISAIFSLEHCTALSAKVISRIEKTRDMQEILTGRMIEGNLIIN